MKQLKNFLTKDIGIKLASLGIAFVVWILVVNVSNPEVSATKTVTVEVLNQNVIESVGKTFEIVGSRTVSVSYNVRTRDAYLIKPTDFRAYIDLNNLYDVTGSVPINVEVVNHEDLIIGTPTARPSVIHITVDDIKRKSLEVFIKTEGSVREGYTLNGVSFKPSIVTIQGPKKETDKIASAQIVVPINDLYESISGSAGIVLCDSDGNVVDPSEKNISLSVEEVIYTADVISGKNIPLTFDYSGIPAPGYVFTGLDISTDSINVVGTGDLLAAVEGVYIPDTEVIIDGARDNVIVQIDINRFLPEGLKCSGDSLVTVVANISPITEMEMVFSDNEIRKNGSGPGYIYSIEPEQITVILSGLAENLVNSTKDTVSIGVDLAGKTPGEYILTPSFTVPENVAVKYYTPFTIKIDIPEEESQEPPEDVLSEYPVSGLENTTESVSTTGEETKKQLESTEEKQSESVEEKQTESLLERTEAVTEETTSEYEQPENP